VRTATRTLAIIDLVAEHGPLMLVEIATRLELPKSSAHGLVRTLTQCGYLEQHRDRSFGLGVHLWKVAQGYDGTGRLRRLIKPIMDELVARTEETVQLGRLEATDVLYLEISLSPHPMKLASAVGEHFPAHATAVGKALLAALDPETARARLGRAGLPGLTSKTITDLDDLMRELALTRQRGYALDNEESLIGLRCLAVPIRDPAAEVVAALSVSIPTPRYNREVATRARRYLEEAAAEATQRLGQAS